MTSAKLESKDVGSFLLGIYIYIFSFIVVKYTNIKYAILTI